MSSNAQSNSRLLFDRIQNTADELELLLQRIPSFAELQPESDAVRAGHTRVSYDDLVRQIDNLAGKMRARGIGVGSRVAILCSHSVQAIVAILAVLELGACYVPLDPEYPAGYLEFLITDSRPACLLTQAALRDRLPKSISSAQTDVPVENFSLIDIFSGLDNEMPSDILPSSRDIAYIMYTSGSTGRPKGVMVSRKGLANYLSWCAEAYGSPAWTESLVGSSLAVDLTITSLFAPLLRGACVTMLPAGQAIDRWLVGLREAVGSCLIKTTPTQFNLLIPHLSADQARKVAVLVLGGEVLDWQSVRQWKRLSPSTRIVNEYGPTETVVGCAFQDVFDVEGQAAQVPIGTAIANTSVYVLDKSLAPCEEGTTGEIYIGGDGVAHGYLRNSGLTAFHFVPDPYGRPGARMYRSGDSGRRHGQSLEFLGRRDEQFKVHGYRVEPGEIESVVLQFPGVVTATVVLQTTLNTMGTVGEMPAEERYPDIRRFNKPEANEPIIVAYMVLQEDAAPTYVELRKWLKERVAAHMVPGVFIRVARLPLLASGKVNRKALNRSIGKEISPAASGDLPRNPVEKALCEIVSDSLGLAAAGIHDNFFNLGGDSIRVIAIHAAARARGLALELSDFFKYQTIAELAGSLANRTGGQHFTGVSSASLSLVNSQDRAALPFAVEDAYPLARMQAGLIFHSYESRHSANYHDVFVYQLRSAFDEQCISKALAHVVQRHPALRTSFALTGYTEPLQLVWKTAEVELSIHDLRERDPECQQQKLMQWVAAEKHRPFDFQRAPLLRLHIHRIADDVAHWAISFHDSILDGWSLATFLVELVTEYAARLANTASADRALVTTYRDFVQREREALHDPAQRVFWANYLQGCTTAVSGFGQVTATDRPYLLEVKLSPELSEGLQSVSRLLRVSIKHVLLAAHVHVVGLMNGQADVLTGMESQGRLEAEDGDRILGMHLNTLPLRVKLHGGTWADLIETVHDAERMIFPYRRYPYASIHKEQDSANLFTTVFNYTHFHRLREIATLPGIEPIGGFGFGQRHYALSAEFNQDPYSSFLRLDLECNLGAADIEHWDRVKRAYESALQAIAADPMDHYDKLGIDECRITVDNPGLDPGTLPTVVEQWLGQVANRANSVALIDGRRELTYAQLYREAGAIAARLQKVRPRTEECVAICLNAGIEQIAAIWAVLAAGASYLILEPELPQGRISHLLTDANARIVISTRNLQDALAIASSDAAKVEWVLLDDLADDPAQDFIARPQIDPDQLAYITYTSGSTGMPKGVRVTHGNLAYSTAVRSLYYEEAVTCFLLIPSLAYDSSVAVLYWTLCTGGTLFIPSNKETRDPGRLIALIERYQVSHWLSVPALYQAVLRQAGKESLRSLQCVIVAGEACPANVASAHYAKCDAVLFNEYGPSETTVWATVCKAREQTTGPTVPIGVPIEGARIYLLDHHLRPVAPDVVGQISISGYGVSRGYGDAILTAERFLPDPFANKPGQRMYSTGDLARRCSGDELEFIGRADRQVKIRGYRVEPAEIEHTLRKIAGVRDVAVVPIDVHDDNGLRLVAYVEADDPSLQVSELRQCCTQLLPPSLTPANFVLLDQLPRTANGKVDVAYLAGVKPGLLDAAAVDRVLARVESMSADEVHSLLRELAVGRF